MTYTIAESHKCECKPATGGQKFVVRFVHANGKPWTCRVCPHFRTLDEAVTHAKRMKEFAQHNPQFSNLRSA